MSRKWRNTIVGVLALAAVVAAVWGASGDGSDTAKESESETDTTTSSDQAVTASDEGSNPSLSASIPEGPLKGKMMPDITLVNRDGDPVSLKDNGGKPAIINVWASWCPPCKKEMPDLQAAYEKHGDQVQFHMVNLTNRDFLDQMDAYLEEEGFTFPVLLDEEGITEKELRILGIPNTFVVDEQGRILHHIAGYMDKKTVEQIMDELTS